MSPLWDLVDSSLPGSSVHGILHGKYIAVGCHFPLQDQSCISSTGRWILDHWATRETVFCCFSANFRLNLFSGKMLGSFQQVPQKLHICACLCQCHPFCPWNLLPFSFSVLFWLTRLCFKALLWHSLVHLFFYQEFTEPSAMLGAGAVTRNVTFIHSFTQQGFLEGLRCASGSVRCRKSSGE